jgi:hypothetical protein
MGMPAEHESVRSSQTYRRRWFLFPRHTSLPPSVDVPQNSDTISPQQRRSRREALALLGGTVGMVVVAANADLIKNFFSSDETLPLSEATDARQKKFVRLYNNMVRTFGREDGLLEEEIGNFNSVATNWSMSRVLDATFAGSMITGALGEVTNSHFETWLKKVDSYWSTFPPGERPGYDPVPPRFNRGRPDRYNDDGLWMGIILLNHFKRTKNRHSLERAQEVFAMVNDQWDDQNGGFFWKMQRRKSTGYPPESIKGRAAVSNAPMIELAMGLYKSPMHDPLHFTVAMKTFQWLRQTLVDGKENPLSNKNKKVRKFDGLLFDNINENNHIGWKKWSYCQGAMIGALVKLSEMDRNPNYPYLKEAYELAQASLTYFDTHGYDENNKNEKGVNAMNAIFFKNLLHLASKIQDDVFTQRVQQVLKKRVDRLSDQYDNLLEHAGAMHLAALHCLPVDCYKDLC